MKKKGFSLIEILILTFIFLSVAILIFGVISNSREFAKTMGCVNNLKNITQAIENYQMDWQETPDTLSLLMPTYIENPDTFQCPNERKKGDSYSKFYIARYVASEDTNKIFILCPRHFGGKRIVTAYLSYSVEIGKKRDVKWSGINAEFGRTYSGGKLIFEDGTIVTVIRGEVGILGSFMETDGKIYSLIYIPEGVNAACEVKHQGNSKFEVITPAVIAGVEGTKFNVENIWDGKLKTDKTTVNVFEGVVNVRERNQGRLMTVNEKESITVETKTYGTPKKNIIPRKPPKVKPHIIKFKKDNS
ncbi:MAG: FecR domain-containing protein [bacterium]|nr:FecR domain-containing protein [bacterium]